MRLQTYIKLNNEAEYRLNQAILDYDTRNEYKSIREEVKKHGQVVSFNAINVA